MSAQHNSTSKTDSDVKFRFAVGYHNNIPVISIPACDSSIDEKQLRNKHKLDNNIKFKISKHDVFIGW